MKPKIKKKTIAIFLTLVLTTSTIAILRNDDQAIATGGGGVNNNTILDYEYVWNITKELCEYGKNNEYGREFGTKGEQDAADYLETKMDNLSLSCVKKDPIDSIWKKNLTNKHWAQGYAGNLSLKRKPIQCWINLTVREKNGTSMKPNSDTVIRYYNLSMPNTSFPLLRATHRFNRYDGYNSTSISVDGGNLVVNKVTDSKGPFEKKCLLIKAPDWTTGKYFENSLVFFLNLCFHV